MPHHCPFPVQLSDHRRCYRSGSASGFSLSLLLLALLAGYAGFGEAAPASASAQGNKPPAVVEKAAPYVGWARGRLLVAPRAGLSAGQFEQALKSVNGRSKGYIRQLNTHVVELSTGADEAAAMRELRKNRKLKYVELDMAVAPAASVSDPAYGNS